MSTPLSKIETDCTALASVDSRLDTDAHARSPLETRLLQGITDAIVGAQTFELALDTALQHVCQSLNWVFAEAWVPNAAQTQLECSRAWYSCKNSLQAFRAASEKVVFAPGEGLPGRVWQSKQPEWIPDVSRSSDRDFLRVRLAQTTLLKAALAVPVLAEGKVLATVVFFLAAPRLEDDEYVRIVSSVAAQLGSIIHCKQAETTSEQKQQQLYTLIDSLPGIVFTGGSDPEWLID